MQTVDCSVILQRSLAPSAPERHQAYASRTSRNNSFPARIICVTVDPGRQMAAHSSSPQLLLHVYIDRESGIDGQRGSTSS